MMAKRTKKSASTTRSASTKKAASTKKKSILGKILTAEGWRRLMMGGSKKTKKR